MMQTAAAVAAVMIFGGTCVYAGYSLLGITHVNDTELPALDPMKKVSAGEIPGSCDESGQIFQDYSSYDEVNELLGGILLDSPHAEENPYMQVSVQTDNKDYGIVTVENYILGDTHDYQLVSDIGRYNCESVKNMAHPYLWRQPICSAAIRKRPAGIQIIWGITNMQVLMCPRKDIR